MIVEAAREIHLGLEVKYYKERPGYIFISGVKSSASSKKQYIQLYINFQFVKDFHL